VGYRISNDRKRTGQFSCSNALLNQIYDITVNTYENLTTGGMTVDCPHRERLGYGGDGHGSMEIALDTFESAAFFSKWAQDWCDVQQPDGNIYHTAPTMGGGGGPGWSGFIIALPWEAYQTYGDKRILEKTYPAVCKWLEFLKAHVSEDGLLAPLPGGSWMFLGDWVAPGRNEESSTPEALLFNNCYYLYVLRLTAKIARVLSKPDDESQWLARAISLQTAINERFLNPATQAYLDTKQTHCVMPLVSGAVAPESIGDVVKNLENEILVACQGHLDTGLHGTYFMTKYLTEHERSDLIFTYATQTTPPSYGDLIARGYQTWPEDWDNAPSRLHGCLNGIGGWFMRGVAGIRPDEDAPGFKHFIIKPAIVGDLTWAKMQFDSLHGRIESGWKRDGGVLAFHIIIPANTNATVVIPAKDPGRVMESGKPAGQSSGVRFVRMEDNAAVYEVGSGDYRFTISGDDGNK
jgi:alpha-L-rhamnosidase